MNVHSSSWLMSQPLIDASNADRRSQILEAALVCFAKRGFHQTSMHDISAEAGISVGLIYRYFENKEAVISAMADRHKEEIQQMLERARQAPSLLESLEILFTAHCCENEPRLISAFVVDLYAEASRNPHVADLTRDVLETAMAGVRDLIARAPVAVAGQCHRSADCQFGFRFWHEGTANRQDDVNADGDAADDSVERNGERRRLGADVVSGRFDLSGAGRSRF